MGRHYETPLATPQEIQRRIEEHFQNPMLSFLRTGLLSILQQHELAVEAGGTPAHRAIETLVARYETLIQPKLGERFAVDAWLIQDLSSSWSSGSIKLPHTILPLYGSEWMWQRLPWIEEPDGSGQRVYAITLKGRDQLNSIGLLQYPWLCHELGHALFSKAPAQFLENFVAIVDDYCRPLSRKAFSDSPEVRAITKSNVEQIRKRWIPRGDQQSWIHELAVDIIALWSCGPAFLAAMMDAAANAEPFLIESPHPPYALRLKMLARGAKELGWQNEAQCLVDLESRWCSKTPATNRNQYFALCPTELIQAALSWSLKACIEWKIPQCNRGLLNDFAIRRKQNHAIDSAIELIVSAFLIYENERSTYPGWEAQTVRSLRTELNRDP